MKQEVHVAKRPELPSGFQGKVFKDRVRERGCRECNQLMDIVLIAWWWGHGRQHHQPGSNRSGGYVLVGSIVNFFHLVAVSVSTKQLRGQGSEYLSSGFGEELKAFDFVERLNYHFVLHDCFPLFLHFFTSLITFILWNLGEAQEASFSANKRQVGSVLGRPHRVLLSYISNP